MCVLLGKLIVQCLLSCILLRLSAHAVFKYFHIIIPSGNSQISSDLALINLLIEYI